MSVKGVYVIAILSLHLAFGAVPPSHSHKNKASAERTADGAYSPRDQGHHANGHHDASFDHEAILGSAKEAEEYDQLSPDEAKKRLKVLVEKIDTDNDHFVSKKELHSWILRSFKSISQEESDERFGESDEDGDGVVTWQEYKRVEFEIDGDEDISTLDPDRLEELSMLEEDKILFEASDKDHNGHLSEDEFLSFTHPEEDNEMIRPVLTLTLKAKDKNGDGKVDFQEYVGDRGKDQTKDWLTQEKERFDEDLDKNKDGSLDDAEIIAWVIPDNNEIASDEVNHLFAGADEDVDGILSVDEILKNHELFVGSEATDYGEHLHDPELLHEEL